MKKIYILITFLGLANNLSSLNASGYLDWDKAKQIVEAIKLPYNLAGAQYKNYVLNKAVSYGLLMLIKLRLRSGEKLRDVDDDGMPILMHAAGLGLKEVVVFLLEKGANVNASDRLGETVLMRTAKSGYKDVVALLLEKGADVNGADNDGQTVLMSAARSASKEVVELLLEKGADVNAADNNGWTALMYAAGSGYKEVVELLLENGADINAVDNNGKKVLMFAARSGYKEVVELLLEKGADVNAADNNGWAALMYAACSGSKEVVELLLKKGADVNAADNNGWTALMYVSNNPKIKNILARYKAFKFITIDQEFDHEPKPEDYFGDQGTTLSGANDLIDSLDKDEERVNAFEKNLAAYWHSKVQKAYEQFTFKNNSEPLRILLTQEPHERIGLILLTISHFFNSRENFIYVLNELKNGASHQELDRLQEIIEEEEYLEKRAIYDKGEYQKALAEIAEKDFVREVQHGAARKIQHAFKNYKQRQVSRQ